MARYWLLLEACRQGMKYATAFTRHGKFTSGKYNIMHTIDPVCRQIFVVETRAVQYYYKFSKSLNPLNPKLFHFLKDLRTKWIITIAWVWLIPDLEWDISFQRFFILKGI